MRCPYCFGRTVIRKFVNLDGVKRWCAAKPVELTTQIRSIQVATGLLNRLSINHNHTSFRHMGLPITPTLLLESGLTVALTGSESTSSLCT